MTAGTPALERALDVLVCPHCRAPLAPTGTGARCSAGHSFDRARQGYLTLLGGRGRRFPGDTTAQVLARENLVAREHYAAVVESVADLATETLLGVTTPAVLDVGAGIGSYLAAVLDRLEETGADEGAGERATSRPSPRRLGIGTELSVAAAKRLARAHVDAAAVVADTWEALPLADGSVDLVMVVFAPRNVAEFDRVLRPGGAALVVGPALGHLEPLRSEMGMLGVEEDKTGRLAADFEGWRQVATRTVDATVVLDRSAAADLVLMGPSGVHLERADIMARLADVSEARLHVDLRVFRR